MNAVVGSPDQESPLQRNRGKILTVSLTIFLAGASLAQAQDTPSTGAAAPASPAAPAHKKAKAAGTADASAAKESGDLKSQGSYSIGVSIGENLHRAGLGTDTVSVERIAQGIREALTGKAKMGPADQEHIGNLVRTARASVGEANHAAAKKFLAENGKNKDVVTTPSGLQYKVLTAGTGAPPKPTDTVTVNYSGKLLDGTEFDSSYKRGQPATFPVNGVIPGWQEALVQMKPGAKWQVFVPPNLGYDLDSPPAIPPGSLLVFDVELLNVKPPQAQPSPQGQPTPQGQSAPQAQQPQQAPK